MIGDTEFKILLDKYKKDGTIVDVRDSIAIVYEDGQFILTANKVGEFWYLKEINNGATCI